MEDLNDIRDFIALHSPKYALEEMGKVFAVADSLQEFPYLGKIASQKFSPPVRQVLSGNYRIIYRIVETDIAEILSVTHGSRQRDLDKLILEPEIGYATADDNFCLLTPEEIVKVEEGLQAIKEGKIISHEEVRKKIDRWLSQLPKEEG